jgi:hypothetical protein
MLTYVVPQRGRCASRRSWFLAARQSHYQLKYRIISIIWGELPDPKGFSVRLGTLLAKYAVRQDNLASEGNL